MTVLPLQNLKSDASLCLHVSVYRSICPIRFSRDCASGKKKKDGYRCWKLKGLFVGRNSVLNVTVCPSGVSISVHALRFKIHDSLNLLDSASTLADKMAQPDPLSDMSKAMKMTLYLLIEH